jgi:DNA-binding transcriptional regulator YhcF (GntR family)
MSMDLILNRRAGISVRDQLVAQLEMKILGGVLAPGQRMPSVRALARRLAVHPNTVSAAYQALQESGYLERRQGSGVFLSSEAPKGLEDARGLDEMIRMALQAAFSRGFSGADIRVAVERWLAAAPPDRVLVADLEIELAELIAAELKDLVSTPVGIDTIDALRAAPERASGAMVVASRHHIGTLKRLLPGVPVEPVPLVVSKVVTQGLQRLPEGALFLAVSHSPVLLEMAAVLANTQRGDEIIVETRPLNKAREWRALARGADLIFADVLSYPVVHPVRPERVREFRVIDEGHLERLRDNLQVVLPRHPIALEMRAADGPARRHR